MLESWLRDEEETSGNRYVFLQNDIEKLRRELGVTKNGYSKKKSQYNNNNQKMLLE